MPANQIQAAWALKKPQHLVYIELGSGNGGMMLGICEEGLSYRAVSPLTSDGPVNFAFALDGKNRLQGVGEIVWSEDAGKTGGLKFTSVSPQFREALRAWLASEAVPKNVGREVTPAAAMPLDSLEKIKEAAREKSVAIPSPPQAQKTEEPKRQFKPRDWSTPVSEVREPFEKPPETNPVEARPFQTECAQTEPTETILIETNQIEPKPTEMERVETTAAALSASREIEPVTPKPAETKPIEAALPESKAAEAIEEEVSQGIPPQKSAVDFLLNRAEPKTQEHLQTDSGVALPKLRLPFSPAPIAQKPVHEPIARERHEPVTAVPQREAVAELSATIPEKPKVVSEEALARPEANLPTEEEVVTALVAPGLLGLHEPKEFVHVDPIQEESSFEFEPPRLNRTAAKAIIGLAFAIICVALVFSFRREVGQALIRFGQILVGLEAKPSVPQQTSPGLVAATPEDDSYPPAAVPLRPLAPQPEPAASQDSQASNATTSDSTRNDSAQASNSTTSDTTGDILTKVPDAPTAAAGGNGLKEFEQARNILKGNHRRRDLPNAVSLLWSSVEKGYVSAEVTLADLYARGDGVEKSCEQARVLLEAAIRKGSPEARRRLTLLKQQGCS
jgi:hypothetical protein